MVKFISGIVVGVLIVVCVSTKRAIHPCSKTLECSYYLNGKKIMTINYDSKTYIFLYDPVNFEQKSTGGRFIADSIAIKIK
jgi:hypothetical protein